MKVLHVIGLIDPAYGGPVTALSELTAAQSRLGAEVTIMATDRWYGPPRGGSPVGLMDWPVAPWLFPARAPHSYNFSTALARRLHRCASGYDVIHLHGVYSFTTAVGALIARRADVALVMEPHGALTSYHHSQKRSKKSLYEALVDFPALRRAAAVRCASRREVEHLVKLGIDKTVVIPHGVSIPVPPRRGVSGKVILFLGRPSAKKRLDVTVEAFSRLLRVIPDARLRIVGEGSVAEVSELRRMMRASGVQANVDLVGGVYGEARWTELAKASAFVLLSDDESYGMAAVEAIAMGVPCVVSENVGAVRDMADHRSTKIVPVDASAAAAELEALLRDADAAESAVAQAERVRTELSWDRVGALTLSLYKALASRDRPNCPGEIDAAAPPGT